MKSRVLSRTSRCWALMFLVKQRRVTLVALLRRAQPLAEEGHHEILESNPHRARVRARIDVERMHEPIPVKQIMQFARVDAQPILIADVNGNAVVLPQVRSEERRVG